MKFWLGVIMGTMDIVGSKTKDGSTLLTSTSDTIDFSDNILQPYEVEQ